MEKMDTLEDSKSKDEDNKITVLGNSAGRKLAISGAPILPDFGRSFLRRFGGGFGPFLSLLGRVLSPLSWGQKEDRPDNERR